MKKLENITYYSGTRLDLLELIPSEKRNGVLLEIGAASGNTLVYAKSNDYAKEVYGIELCLIDDSNQRNKDIKQFVIGDIENIEFPFFDVKFDVIIIGDVLEHLIDPEKVLKNLSKNLAHEGIIIASIPNIRHYSVLKSLILDARFTYQDSGILDKTHLRFFCKINMIELFQSANYKILVIKSGIENDRKKIRFFNKLTFGYFEDFLTVQYYIRATNEN